MRPQGAPRGRAAGDKIDRASRVGNWGGWARQRVRLARVPAIRGHREGVPARPPVRGARKAVWLGRGRDECLGVGVRGREETCPTPQTRDVQVGTGNDGHHVGGQRVSSPLTGTGSERA